ncbi:unnamed protein product [Meloidogyne enterolobii]|uniref:Uncharacterized protein n=1 Tax=Meloidogyne enterolobii TaxID=390850 RepID=A0ACB0Y5Y9_MELEN
MKDCKILDDIKGKALKTIYFHKSGTKRIIFCDGITTLGSHQIRAYGMEFKIFRLGIRGFILAF